MIDRYRSSAMNTTDQVNKFIVNTRFEDIPQEALDVAKKEVIDAVATSLAGSGNKAAGELYEFVKSLGEEKRVR